MAIYNEILVGRYSRFLQKLFGIKGSVPAKQLSGEIAATFALFGGVENRYLEGWNRFGATYNVNAVAAQNSVWRFRNAVAANVLVVIERLGVIETVADNVAPYLQLTLQATTVDEVNLFGTGGLRLDPRGAANPSVIASWANNVSASGSRLLALPLTANSTENQVIAFEEQELPLFAGDAYTLFTTAVNTGLWLNIIWRERFIEEAERT